MSKSLWEIIELSKKNEKIVPAAKQYDNLVAVLSELPKEEVKSIHEEWMNAVFVMQKNPEYEKLHISDGGIVDGGDDTFYIDFGNWIIAQGKELYDEFMSKGHSVIIDYIKRNNLKKAEYTFECMEYAFQDILE